MAFLTPAFFLGLAAIAIPVLVHLIQRERKRVVEFPSLMFVRRIPYQSVRRRRIRHWGLLLLRAAAIAMLVADFQRAGWPGSEDVHFPDAISLTPISVAGLAFTNIAVPSIAFARASFSGQERVTVTAGVANKGPDPVANVPVTLEMDGHAIQTQHVSVAGNTTASVSFTPFTLDKPRMKGTVRAGTDPMPADNTFHFVVAPSEPVSILVVDAADRSDSALYLSKALAIGSTPAFQLDIVPVLRVTPANFDKHSVIVLNDVPLPAAAG